MKNKTPHVVCPYCNRNAELVTGKKIYPHRPDLSILNYWLCFPCDALVGCHKKGIGHGHGNGITPLGRPANKKLRTLRVQAHQHFDKIWKEGPMTRSTAYRVLANSLEIEARVCHISQFSEALCEKTIRICKLNIYTKKETQ